MRRPSLSRWLPPGLTRPAPRTAFRPALHALDERVVPATRVWDGSTSGTWSTATNWVGDVAPVAGDDLVFDTATSGQISVGTLTATNDFAAGTAFASVTFQSGSFLLDGNAFSTPRIAVALPAGVGVNFTNTISAPVALTGAGAAVDVSALSANGTLVFAAPGGVTLPATGATFTTAANTFISVNAPITGPGGLVTAGLGQTTLTAANTFAGPLTARSGSLRLASPALGGVAQPSVPAGGLIVGDGTTGLLPNVTATLSNQVADAAAVTVAANGTLAFGANADAFASLSNAGAVTTDAQLTLGTGSGTALTLTGGSVSGAGSILLNGNVATVASGTGATVGVTVDLGGASRTIAVANGAAATDLTFTKAISNGSALTFDDAGKTEVQQAVGAATLILRDGTLVSNIANPAGAGGVNVNVAVLPALIQIGNDTGGAGTARLRTARVDQIEGSSLDVRADGVFDLNGFDQTVGALDGAAGAQALLGTAGAQLAVGVGQAANAGTYLGSITGTGSVLKVFSGTLTLGGDNVITNAAPGLVVRAGALVLNGATTGSGSGVSLGDGGTNYATEVLPTVSGSGSAGALTTNYTPATNRSGTIDPGSGAFGTGRLTFASVDATDADGATSFAFQLNGVQPGTGYDQLRILAGGTTKLSPAAGQNPLLLTIGGGFTVPQGAGFTLIDNQSANPLLGALSYDFGGTIGVQKLAEGKDIPYGAGRNLRVSYVGGDGNDLVVTDTGAPTTTITRVSPQIINFWPARFRVDFSGPVTGFTGADVTTNPFFGGGFTYAVSAVTAAQDPLAIPGQSYFVDVTGPADFTGQFGIDVAAGSATTSAGTGNLGGATSFLQQVLVDTIEPTVSVTSSAPATTNQSPVTVTVTFSEFVNDFTESDLALVNGAATNFAPVAGSGGTRWTFTFTPSGDGPYSVGVPGGAVTDQALNPNFSGNFNGVFDATRPGATITLQSTQPSSAPGDFRVVFSEPINELTLSGFDFDVTVTPDGGGTYTGPSPSVQLLNVVTTPTGTTLVARINGLAGVGTAQLSLRDSSVNDPAGNGNLVAVSDAPFPYNTVPPTVALTATTPTRTNLGFVDVTAVFSQVVVGFVAGDIAVTGGGAVTNFSANADGRTYTFRVQQGAGSGGGLPVDAPFTIAVPRGVAAGPAGATNLDSNTVSGSFDGVSPTPFVTSSVGGTTGLSAVPITVTFSEDVTGFDITDITATGGTLDVATFRQLNASTYTVSLRRTFDGDYTVSVGANKALDLAGNGNQASAPLNGRFDTTGPTVAVVPVQATVRSSAAVEFNIDFSEDVVAAQLTPADFDLTGTTAAGTPFVSVQQLGASTFRVAVTGLTGDGLVRLAVRGDATTDLGGSPNLASSPATVVIDGGAPVPTIGAPAGTFATSAPLTVTFNEPATGLTAADILVTNGTVLNFFSAGDGRSYTFNVVRTADGPFTAQVRAGAATDAAGNTNVASGVFSGVFDTAAPTVTLTTTLADRSSATVVARFSKAVVGFDASDVAVGGAASLVNVRALDAQTYEITLVRSADGAYTVGIPDGAATDERGIPLRGASTGGTFNTARPTATVSPAGNTSFSATFLVTFSAPVLSPLTTSGLLAGAGVDLASATITAAGDRAFLVTVTGSGVRPNATVTLAVAENAVTDTLGNPSLASNTGSQTLPAVIAPPAGPRPFAVGSGPGRESLVTVVNPDGSVREQFAPFGAGFTGGVRVAQADFNGDGTLDIVVATGPGAPSIVTIYDGATRAVLFDDQPFEASFLGGVNIAVGDLNGDGLPELVMSPDEGGGPRVKVVNGSGFGVLADFFGIDDANFRGGARTAVGDINGDGAGDLIVAAGFGGGPRVAGYDGSSLTNGRFSRRLFADRFVFEPTLRNGVYVAAGDIDRDGFADLITGGGPGGGPRVLVFNGRSLVGGGGEEVVANFFAGDESNRDGVPVASRDVNGDGFADVITASGGRARVISGAGLARVAPPTDLINEELGGVYVG